MTISQVPAAPVTACSACGAPAHATETDDADRCAACRPAAPAPAAPPAPTRAPCFASGGGVVLSPDDRHRGWFRCPDCGRILMLAAGQRRDTADGHGREITIRRHLPPPPKAAPKPPVRWGITKSKAGHWTVWVKQPTGTLCADRLSSDWKAQQVLEGFKAAIATTSWDPAQPSAYYQAVRRAFDGVRRRWGLA